MKKVNIEDVLRIQKERRAINRPKFSNLRFYKDGVLLKFKKENLDKFEFIGLNNMDFITSGMWKDALK